MVNRIVAILLAYSSATLASPISVHFRRAVSPYAPVQQTCPSTQLVRAANGLSDAEATYISNRYAKASESLQAWLQAIDPTFECGGGYGADASGSKAPVVALTSSGGGYRAMLAGAGVIKGLDGRESATGSNVSGLYQSLTYEAGLSGGSWLLSSLAGNDYPTISSLQANLWEPSLVFNILIPQVLLSPQAAPVYAAIEADVAAKDAAGFSESIIDPWGRILSYGLLYGPDGGVSDTISDIAAYDNFTAYNAPYPIITALGVDRAAGVCNPPPNATQYEFHPYEFGSWDAGVDAFVSSEYLGTSFSNGLPTGSCVTGFDNLGYVLGISSNIFGAVCSPIPAANNSGTDALAVIQNLAELTAPGQLGVPADALFAPIPNPFRNYPSSPLVSSQAQLALVDGGVGVASQGNPIWPFLNRDVDVIIVNDNSADTIDNFPNGTEILNTYNAAVAAGLTRMPVIPSVDTFVAEHLNQKPTFFGCNSTDTATIIYIPNFNYTFQSGLPTAKIQYLVNETQGMISNGVEIANYGGKEGWPLCLACGIMAKSGETLPMGCTQCLEEYCYN